MLIITYYTVVYNINIYIPRRKEVKTTDQKVAGKNTGLRKIKKSMRLEKKMDSVLFPMGETSNISWKNREDSVVLGYLRSS